MKNLIARRLSNIKPSATLAVTAKAAELRSAGKDVIGLGAGEPDFDTPNNIKNAGIDAIKKGFTRYTKVDGLPDLKDAIIKKFKRDNGLEYCANEITVGSGAKQVIFNALCAMINDGDEVIIPAPYWVSYPDMVSLFGGVPVIARPDQDLKVSAKTLEKCITSKTKLLILNSPCNPTGLCYTKQEMRDIGAMLENHPTICVISDDIYEHILYDDAEFSNIAQVSSGLRARTFVVNGVSKAYSMTGWRIGYGAGDESLIKAISKIQSQSTSNPCSISQYAAIEALNGTQDFIKKHNDSFKHRRDICIEEINKINGLKCNGAEGAFYLFIDCMGLYNRTTKNGTQLKTDSDVVSYLLEDALVAVVQGSAFGFEGFFRVSYALPEKSLREALKRIKKACDALQVKRI